VSPGSNRRDFVPAGGFPAAAGRPDAPIVD